VAPVTDCPHCGAPANPALPVHTPGCGMPLRNVATPAPAPVPEPTRCPDPTCGAVLTPGATRCGLCEAPVAPQDPVTPPHAPPPQISATRGSPASVTAAPEGALTLRFPDGTLPVVQLPIVLGRDPARSPAADLCARFDNVSRVHCELSSDGGALTVRDLGSSNGTFVDDRPVAATAPLHPGAVLRLGRDLCIEVRRG
jgi:hypothetical protein